MIITRGVVAVPSDDEPVTLVPGIPGTQMTVLSMSPLTVRCEAVSVVEEPHHVPPEERDRP